MTWFPRPVGAMLYWLLVPLYVGPVSTIQVFNFKSSDDITFLKLSNEPSFALHTNRGAWTKKDFTKSMELTVISGCLQSSQLDLNLT